MVGDDGDGWEMLKKLQGRRVDTSNVIISDRIVTPAYIKPLFPKEGNRFDIKNFSPTPDDLQDELIRRIESALQRSDALLLLDQVCESNTGVLTARVRDAIARMDAKTASERARAGDEGYRAIFDRAGEVLGRGIAALQQLLDVDRVIIGGSVSASMDLLRPALVRSAQAGSYWADYPENWLFSATLQPDSGLYGAACLAAEHFRGETKEVFHP